MADDSKDVLNLLNEAEADLWKAFTTILLAPEIRACLPVWLNQLIYRRKKEKEKERYANMADDSKDVLNLLNEAGEAVITLNICHEKSTTETMKRILPWLDAIGENLQYFSTEVVIESKITYEDIR
ncbi:hypothetical protein DINM_000344 [Dirofilaria immitis]|nr:hypothetical protein [Dirofilaria immitis]